MNLSEREEFGPHHNPVYCMLFLTHYLKVLDRMDLGCLMTAEMRTIPWKSSQQ